MLCSLAALAWKSPPPPPPPPRLANSARFTAATGGVVYRVQSGQRPNSNRWFTTSFLCLQSLVRTTPKLQPLVYSILPLPTEFSQDNGQTPSIRLQHPSSEEGAGKRGLGWCGQRTPPFMNSLNMRSPLLYRALVFPFFFFFHGALRPQKQSDLLGKRWSGGRIG